MTEVVPRRERLRIETTAEIKQRAWASMAEVGTDALSLRAVARQMGMAPSALYRYFASRNDLLTALIIDGFTGLAGALRKAFDESCRRGDGAADVWLAVCAGYPMQHSEAQFLVTLQALTASVARS
ncbi:TetR/AcrR family transcriptional regulator [uncultured Jatrophihabitans sp.]|uniref:TetR/AcrR family transcriptional regulator n=1 Tax=uncultured Jatrophihabitans sp. TaxID=1610747 RepID=UPI0035CB6826